MPQRPDTATAPLLPLWRSGHRGGRQAVVMIRLRRDLIGMTPRIEHNVGHGRAVYR
ncbi:MAG: hypothetical protein QOD72_1858, partial [Acidimicrobiaceae bacterium]|nr:hypothetical protein [Acidimicrobiaceae bacterium]